MCFVPAPFAFLTVHVGFQNIVVMIADGDGEVAGPTIGLRAAAQRDVQHVPATKFQKPIKRPARIMQDPFSTRLTEGD